MDKTKLDKALNLIKDSKSIALVPSKVAGADSFSAAVGMYFMLLEQGKDVFFVYPGKIPEEADGLIEKDRIISNTSERELLITIDYANTPAAAAHYSTEDDVLQIKLGPVSKDFSMLDHVSAQLVGYDFDTIVVFGAQEIQELGATFENLRESFSRAKVINFDNTQKNGEFGDIDLIDPLSSSLSHQVLKCGAAWNIVPSEKAAKALLVGMTYRNGNSPLANK